MYSIYNMEIGYYKKGSLFPNFVTFDPVRFTAYLSKNQYIYVQ